ncbi:MAG: PhoH family protein [Desulfovibrio sp.]|nr:PhoH family protein [Desulfovibrio sp.]
MERLLFDDPDLAAVLFGPQNLHLQTLAKASGARLFNRGNTLFIETEDQHVSTTLVKLFLTLYEEVRDGKPIENEGLPGLYTFFSEDFETRKARREAYAKGELGKNGKTEEKETKDNKPKEKKPLLKTTPSKATTPISPLRSSEKPSFAPHATTSLSRERGSVPETFASLQTPKKIVTARNTSQQTYIELLRSHEIVFALGPAGTGKTYLAVAHAVQLLQQHSIKKLILTRPAVEAGEKLGFLPGDLIEKINPYLRPLYDALYDMLPQAKVAALCELGSIEIAPLAFMRGRTLNDSCIILDEAQNTTREQMKMFLTRMGFGSKMIITGDTTQIDLPQDAKGEQKQSGLVHATTILHDIRGIAFHTFKKEDVVRHQLVGEIVNAYDIAENRRAKL